jgi:urea transporter
LTGLYLDLDRTKLRQGYLAANSVLIGTSLVDFFVGGGWPVQVCWSILLAPITLLVTLWLQHSVLASTNTPVLLLPYNMVMVFVLISANVYDSTMVDNATTITEGDTHPDRYFAYQAVLNGIARIFLVDGVVAGAMILMGILMCSRILALAVVGGAFFSSLFSWAVLDESPSFINGGLAGFNPALAMAGIFFYLVPSWKLTGLAFCWLIFTMLVTTVVTVALNVMYVECFGPF